MGTVLLIGVQLVGQRAFGGGYGLVVVTAWGLLACALVFNRYLFADLIGVLVCGVDTALLVMALLLRHPSAAGVGLPILVSSHVTAMVLSYVVLTLAAISALASPGARPQPQAQVTGAAWSPSLPPLATLQAFTHNLVLVGFVALTVGIVLSQAWGACGSPPHQLLRPARVVGAGLVGCTASTPRSP